MWKRFISAMCSIAVVVQCIIALPVSVTAITIQDNSANQAPLKTAFNYNGHSYYTFSGKASSWEDAQKYCESLGGYLSVINDLDENDFLFSLIQQQGYDSAYFGFYLDLSDPMDCRWRWVHGTSSFVHWDEGEPNNNGLNERNGMFYGSSYWNDGHFGEVSEFICEWDYEDASVVNLNSEAGNKIVYGGHSYAFFNYIVDTWEEAKAFCESQGGYLAVINDSEENIALYEMMRAVGYESAYFGYTDSVEEGNWQWIDADQSNYENFHKSDDDFYNEPNNGQGFTDENYAMFYFKYTDGSWNDGDFGFYTEGEDKVFICEWNTVKTTNKEYEDKSFDIHYTGNDKIKYSIHLDQKYSIDFAVSNWGSTEYNQYLAYLLSALASSAYTPNDIEFNLNSLGFKNYRMFNYYTNPTDPNYQPDSCAFSIAQKTLSNGERVVLIPIRGSYGGLSVDDLTGKKPNSDWTSDFNIQDINDEIVHVGFTKAKEEVMEKISFVLGEIPTSGVRFVITGHSRAAGIANLLSKELMDMGVPRKNVFDYNFACPDVAKDLSNNWNSKGKYDNIFNIGVAGDPVTTIPGCLGNLIDEANPASIFNKYGEWGKYGQSRWVCMDWNNAPITQVYLNNHAHEFYVENMAAEQHLAQMKTWRQMKKTEFVSTVKNTLLTTIGIYCPVSVELVDSDGHIIASINNDEVYVDDKFNDGSVIAWSEDDEKFFVLNNSLDYSINLIGTDDGTMDCTITTLKNGHYQTASGSFYENIELYSGKTMKIDINTSSNYQGNEMTVFVDDGKDETIKADYFQAPSIYGDMNQDDQLLVSDAVLLARFISEDESLDISNLNLDMADVNCDEYVDLIDIVELLKALQIEAA